MSSKHVHFDAHIFTPGTGHASSEDCWCEPIKTYWVPGADGRMLHVLEHNEIDTCAPEWVNDLLNHVGKD
jgi:hypothetical protein